LCPTGEVSEATRYFANPDTFKTMSIYVDPMARALPDAPPNRGGSLQATPFGSAKEAPKRQISADAIFEDGALPLDNGFIAT